MTKRSPAHIPIAFLSYARFDDEHEEGKLSLLVKRLSSEVQMHTGEAFPIFQDRTDIGWGEEWAARIEQAIESVTFFIPVMTPSFFQSQACRKELESFLDHERRIGRSDLILPLYYLECPILEDSAKRFTDPLATVLADRQCVDWRHLRFRALNKRKAAQCLAQMARQIRDTVDRIATELGAGCTVCGQDWMNHPYATSPLILQGGSEPQRKVLCPKHSVEIRGWDDLMERSVFFDAFESEYVIWIDDPLAEGCDELQLPPHGERVGVRSLGDGRGEARFRFKRAEVIVRGRLVKRSEVLLNQVVELPLSANAKVLPINGEEAACLDWNQGGIFESGSLKGQWKVHLRGGWRPFLWQAEGFWDPVLSEPDNATLLLWPGFDDSNWKSETVVYGLKSPTRNSPKVRCYGAGSRSRRLLGEHYGLDVAHSMAHFKERVEALEFRSAQNAPLGYLLPKRRILHPSPVTEAIVALDFGTRATVVCWKPPNERPEAVVMDQDAPPIELMASSDIEERKTIAGDLQLLPFWPKFNRWLISSELLVFRGSGQWVIPNEFIDPAHLEGQVIRRDFKWIDNSGVECFIYLRIVLLMAMASLRARGIKSVSLRATVPPVFEEAALQRYEKTLLELSAGIAAETGMCITLEGFATELISSMQVIGSPVGNLQCFVESVGPRTTVMLRFVHPSRGFEEPFIIDSIGIGGNDVVESLLADSELVEGIGRNVHLPGVVRFVRPIVLRDLLSSGSEIPGWWPKVASSSAAEFFSMRSRAIFDGILGYTLKLISAAEKEMRSSGELRNDEDVLVDVLLLGDSWNILRFQSTPGNVIPQVYMEARLRELQGVLPFARPNWQFEVRVPDARICNNHKLAASFGAALLPAVSPISELETGQRTVFGINIDLFNGQRLDTDEFLDTVRTGAATTSAVKATDIWDQFAKPLLHAPGVTDYIRQLFGSNDKQRRSLFESCLRHVFDVHTAGQLATGRKHLNSPLGLLLAELWTERLRAAGSISRQ